jgi:Asp-tRNA(Asn)/Glu-tRNA(Gln) amidotransferase A subunit family amidase
MYAERLGYDLNDPTLARFTDVLDDVESTLEPLDELAPGPPPDRDSWDTDESEDPNGAFLRRCDAGGDREGPLAGTRVAVKDNLAVAGVEMTCGSPALSGYVPSEDATAVARLLEAGGRVVGKTTLDAFAYAHQPDPTPFRTPRNPHDPASHPGSSSSGSGVAVADGLADVALGSDNGGSTRYPAAWCGVVGLKPTRGLVSHHGLVLSAKTLDTVGVLARTTTDVARTLEVVAGPDYRDDATAGAEVGEYTAAVQRGSDAPPDDLVIGVPESFVGTAPDRDAVALAALDDLEAAGATVRSITIDDISLARPAYAAINWTETGAYLRGRASTLWRQSVPDPTLQAAMQAVFTGGSGEFPEWVHQATLFSAVLRDEWGNRYYALGQRARHRVEAGLDAAFEDVDLLASATVAASPPKLGDEIPPEAATNTLPANVGGHPAVSVPCGRLDGLPVGLQFVAPRFYEERALRAAAHWEAIRDR